MYNVGRYTLAPWKVLWPEVGDTVRAGVVGPTSSDSEKPTVPDHTVVAVGCRNSEEAHFICALLNSGPAQLLVRGYIALHPSPHILDHVRIPHYKEKQPLHKLLAKLSENAHRATRDCRSEVVNEIEREIDKAAGKLWDINDKELMQIQRALND